MWIARINKGIEYPPARIDDFVTDLVKRREVRRPRLPRAWRTEHGAAAISQSPEGAIASARRVLEQPENGRRVMNTIAELIETMKGAA